MEGARGKKKTKKQEVEKGEKRNTIASEHGSGRSKHISDHQKKSERETNFVAFTKPPCEAGDTGQHDPQSKSQ